MKSKSQVFKTALSKKEQQKKLHENNANFISQIQYQQMQKAIQMSKGNKGMNSEGSQLFKQKSANQSKQMSRTGTNFMSLRNQNLEMYNSVPEDRYLQTMEKD